jgi:hypothetical protein
MKRFASLGIVSLMILFGCNRGPQGPYDTDDEVVIHGTFQDETGSAYGDHWVGFWINSPESFFTNCLGLDPEEKDKTDGSGNYSEDFMGGDLMDTQGATFPVAVMNFDPSWPDTIPRVRCDFYALSVDVTVPTLKLWRGNPSTTIGATNVTFAWQKLSTTHDSEPDQYTFQVKATQDGVGYNMWQEDMGSGTSFTLPAYVLPAAYTKKWRVVAEIAAPSESDFGYAYLTDPDETTIPDTTYQLLSLGKACRAEAYDQNFPKATDGKWGPWPTYAACFAATNVSWVYVDLSDTTHTVNAVVLYGMTIAGNPSTPGYDVYVANDTTSWGSAVASSDEKNGYFYVEGFSKHGRYVKLQAKDNGIGITGFREIGIFGQ